ncbi:MAG: glycosyltransferase, partial [Pedobacter sp.]
MQFVIAGDIDMTTLSIITITKDNYDDLKFTFESLKKIIDSNTNTVEWVVVDGSKNKDNATIETISSTENVKYLIEAKPGISHAFNVGIQNSTKSWLLFINAGDTLINRDLLKVIADVDESIAIVYGISEIFDTERRRVVAHQGTKIKHWPPMRMPFNHQSAFYRKSSFSSYGLFRTDYKLAMDYEHLLRLKLNQIKFINIVISRFYLGGASSNIIAVYREWSSALQENNYSKIKFNDHGICPFLSETKLCKIYQHLGEKALSRTCKTYPRIENNFRNEVHRSLSMSCPEVAKLVLFDPDALRYHEEQHLVASYPELKDRSLENKMINVFCCSLLQIQTPYIEDNLYA